jgi:hypothetical protein
MMFLKKSGKLIGEYEERDKDIDANYEEFITELSKRLGYTESSKVRNEFQKIETKIRELPNIYQSLFPSRVDVNN